MQIPSIPPPILTNPLPQDVAAKAVPHMQAVTPLVQKSVDPAPKSEKFNQSRSNRDKGRGQDRQDRGRSEDHPEGCMRGKSLNIDV